MFRERFGILCTVFPSLSPFLFPSPSCLLFYCHSLAIEPEGYRSLLGSVLLLSLFSVPITPSCPQRFLFSSLLLSFDTLSICRSACYVLDVSANLSVQSVSGSKGYGEIELTTVATSTSHFPTSQWVSLTRLWPVQAMSSSTLSAS